MTVKFCYAGTVLSPEKTQESSSFPFLPAGASSLRAITVCYEQELYLLSGAQALKYYDFTATHDEALNEDAKPLHMLQHTNCVLFSLLEVFELLLFWMLNVKTVKSGVEFSRLRC